MLDAQKKYKFFVTITQVLNNAITTISSLITMTSVENPVCQADPQSRQLKLQLCRMIVKHI